MITPGQPLKSYPRRIPITQVVIHESVTSTREDCLKVLSTKGYGVHFTVDRDGSIEQHIPLPRYAIHAGAGHNRNSVAIEVINRYYGVKAEPGQEVIKVPWAHKGLYIVPTPEQLEAVWALLFFVNKETRVPMEFPGVRGGDFVWGRVKLVEARQPGVMAHHRWEHADGLFIEHYCFQRHNGQNPSEAFRLTIEAAQKRRP